VGLRVPSEKDPQKNMNILPSTKPYQHLVGDEPVESILHRMTRVVRYFRVYREWLPCQNDNFRKEKDAGSNPVSD